jgi:predicted ThiF/HesA family dinucleotide-utilizing enzyme
LPDIGVGIVVDVVVVVVAGARGLPTTANTMGTVSQPVGGQGPAAEGKLGKVFHEEKTNVVVRSGGDRKSLVKRCLL